MSDLSTIDVSVISDIITALNKLEPEARVRVIQSISTLYGISRGPHERASQLTPEPQRTSFSEDRSLSPKEFIWQKKPTTSVERVVCLAYYLQHYRGMRQFKTSDISSLNTEAAQVKFSNPAMMVGEATRAGYLATVSGQEKQLSMIGEQFVTHLPDREAAMEAVRHLRPRRPKKKIGSLNKGEIQSD